MTGRTQSATGSAMDLFSLLPLAVIVVAAIASFQAQEVWAAALVAIVAAWAVDLSTTFAARGRRFAPLAVVTCAAAGALAAHALGGSGYGLTVAIVVAVCLGWGVFFKAYRAVDVYAPTLLVGLLAGLGVGSLVLANSAGTPDTSAVAIFLLAVVAAQVAGSVVSRLPNFPFLDAYSTSAIVAVVASLIGAAIWESDIVGYLLVGLGIAIALIAGHGFSTMLRTGQVRLTERAPGLLPSLDGVALAAAIYYPLISLIL